MNKIVKSLSVIAFVGAVALTMTGAFFSDSGKSTGNTFSSGDMDLQLANSYNGGLLHDNVTQTWNTVNMEPGGTPYNSSLYMKNVGSIDADHMSFAVTELSSTTSAHADSVAGKMRITKLDYSTLTSGNPVGTKSLLTGGAGADLSNYVAPTYCDVTVASGGTIATGIGAAATGDVVCVKAGNYPENVIVNKDITLVSSDGQGLAIISPASGNAVTISNNDVTVKGFAITGGGWGVSITGQEGIVIRDNIISGYTAEGINVDGGTVSILNNVIVASPTPASASVDSIYTKSGAVVTITNNDLGNNGYSGSIATGNPNPGAWSTSAGLSVHKGDNVTATYNQIYGNDFGIHVKGKTGDVSITTVTAHYNNIMDTNTVAFFYEKIDTNETTILFDVINNWWGTMDKNDIQQKISSTDPNFMPTIEPYAGGPFIGYINGVDNNNNHYADLYDFYAQSAQGLDAEPGLASAQWGRLDMAVQLDGPTTGNTYQGTNLTMDMTVTMQQ